MSTPISASAAMPVLQARGLIKRYGNVTALDGCDFEVMPGEIIAVIGDNGAGKSSLIKALSGAVVPDQGEILLDGKPVKFRSPLDARRARHRDGLSGPRGRARDEHRRKPFPRPRTAKPGFRGNDASR
jgi:ABC-type transporter Mla maintaining outer membrane lipid asymmetry ATPase subunit MlaF